jgi:23S rRNA pseudouridine1911/1915/1917 synthase
VPNELDAKNLSFEVPADKDGLRIDLYLTLECDGYSRVFLRRVIAEGHVTVNGQSVKPAFKVHTGQHVTIALPPPPDDGPIPEDILLKVIWEDDHLVIVDKPPFMVVHPAKGHWHGTLTAALAHHFKTLSDVGGPTRPGIVHRLDRDTSGVIAIAKTNEAHFKLAAQFESRDIEKEYRCIVIGRIDHDRDWIRAPIGHHPYQREKMAIRDGHHSSRHAETFFEVIERFAGYSYLRVLPKTGRTHQIRVHLDHVGHPVLCDKLYAGHATVTKAHLLRKALQGKPLTTDDQTVVMDRQALHAYRIKFDHPITRKAMEFTAPLPDDFERALQVLKQSATS